MSTPDSSPDLIKRFIGALGKSRFLTVSVLLHLLLVFILGGTVLFNVYVEPDDFIGGGGDRNFLDESQMVAAPPPPPAPSMPTEATPQVVTPVQQNTSPIQAIKTIAPSTSSFTLPSIAPKIPAPSTSLTQNIPAPPAPSMGTGQMSTQAASAIKSFTQGWGKGRGQGSGQGTRQRTFEFTAYIAKYSGGDWNSTVQIRDNRIVTGSLPNLLYTMKAWSNGRIAADPNPVPLDLASEEIFAKKPPFIFFTGHRDFKLTEKEVANLTRYVRLGGAIWGDSSLAGRRSRFDIAFRREMRRVIPDVDKDFEPIPANHPIFTQPYFTDVKEVPPGVNYYQEPVYALKMYDEISIFYTSNNYGDMWQVGLDEEGNVDTRRDRQGRYVALNDRIWGLRDTYVRNLSPESIAQSYKFGTNIVIHLLTRWESKVSSAPDI